MMKEKEPVVFINPPTNLRKPDATFPLGVLYLASQLEQAGHHVEVINAAIKPLDPDILSGFRVVAISTTTPQYPEAVSILEMIKSLGPLKRVIVGGPHVTVFKERVLKNGWDAACAGEGELVIESLVNNKLSGLIHGPRVAQLDKLPFPARHLVDPKRYIRERETEPSAAIITSRGCPYRCIYCAKEVIGNRVRYRSPENVADEIKETIKRYGIRKWVFYDDTFTLNRERTLALAKLLRPLDISFIFNTRVDRVDQELLQRLHLAGAQEVSFGQESGNQDVLDEAQKGITVQQGIEAVRMAKDAGLKTRLFLMFGFPSDSWQSVKDNLEFVNKAQPDSVRLSLLVPLPGSELFERAEEFGIPLSQDPTQYYYAAAGGPQTFITETQYLDESQFKKALEELQHGLLKWATTSGGGCNITTITPDEKTL